MYRGKKVLLIAGGGTLGTYTAPILPRYKVEYEPKLIYSAGKNKRKEK